MTLTFSPHLAAAVRSNSTQDSLAELAPTPAPKGWGLRAVQEINELFRELTEPAGLFAMGVGSAAFRAGKLFAQSGLFSGVGWGARIGSSLFGMATESLAFTEADHIFQGTGQGREITGTQWLHQWGHNAWLLGTMRGAGLAFGALGAWAHGPELLRSRVLAPLYQQAGMYAGILVGHGLSQDFESPSQHLLQSLGYLLKFNLGGLLAQRTVGRFLHPMEQQMEGKIRQQEVVPVKVLVPQYVGGEADEAGIQSYYQKKWGIREASPPRPYHPTVMGIASTPEGEALASFSNTVRMAQEQMIRELKSAEGTMADKVAQDEWLSDFLLAHEIPSHPYDLKLFRAGFSLGKIHYELTRRMAWDVDEVQLHWSLNPADIFRGLFQGRNEVPFQNTPSEVINYTPFAAAPEVELPKWQRFWYDGVQRLVPSRMRQVIQFHPGGRAFLLGMQGSVGEPLTLITTGPAGRLLILVNEDPALKKIYFNKGPTETVTMEEIRAARNIYTREDLVKAMRVVAEADAELLKDPLVQDYIEKIKAYPKQGHKLKHPALARILKKRSFDILVDDSDSTYRMLGRLPNFAIFKPASARPSYSLNFVLGSRDRYLDRMANGFYGVLASHLEGNIEYLSKEISAGHLPDDYPIQRFPIEVPWERYRHEFALPGVELERLAEKIAGIVLPKTPELPDEIYALDGKDYRILGTGRKIVVLGDNGPGRVLPLAEQGHHPLVIDWDAEELQLAQRHFKRFNRIHMQNGTFDREVSAQWLKGDWYKTRAEADAVEVFFPFYYDKFNAESMEFVRRFMEVALHTKLKPQGGTIYLVTECRFLIEDMKAIVERDPTLKLIGMEISTEYAPIRGGHAALPGWEGERSSWIFYQKKPE